MHETALNAAVSRQDAVENPIVDVQINLEKDVRLRIEEPALDAVDTNSNAVDAVGASQIDERTSSNINISDRADQTAFNTVGDATNAVRSFEATYDNKRRLDHLYRYHTLFCSYLRLGHTTNGGKRRRFWFKRRRVYYS